MIFYLFFLILVFLSLIEGELLGISNFLFLGFCLPLAFYIYKQKSLIIDNNKKTIYLLFLGFLFFSFLSLFFSPVSSRVLNNLILYLAYFIYFLAVQFLVKKTKLFDFKSLLVASVFFPSLVLCFLSFYLFFTHQKPPFSTMNLIYAHFGHNHLVDFLIFAFPLNLGLLMTEKDKFKRVFYWLASFLFTLAFILSFSRGGILMLIFILVLFEVFIIRKTIGQEYKPKALNFFTRFLVLLLFFTLILSFWGSKHFDQENLKDFFVVKKAFRQLPFESRIEYWQQAVLAFKEKLLFGWGLDNFRYASLKYQKQTSSWSWYVHNHFLQLFAETGFFGGLIFLILVFFIIKTVFKNIVLRSKILKTKDYLNVSLGIGVLASVVHNFFDYDWQFTSVFLFFWVIAGYLLSISQDKKGLKNLELSIFVKTLVLFLGALIFIIGLLQFQSNLFILLGGEANKTKNYQREEKLYNLGIKFWPLKLENYQILADFYKKNNQSKKAIVVLKNLLKLEPINDKNYLQLAELEEDIDKKISYYFKAIELNPSSSLYLYLKIIDTWSIEGKEGQQLFEILTKIEQLKGEKCLLKCIEFENEEKILNLLLQLIKSKDFGQLDHEQQARVYFWLAVLTTYQQDWNQDIDFLKKAVSLDNRKEYHLFLNDLLLIQKIEESFKNNDFNTVKILARSFEAKETNHAFHEKFYLYKAPFILGKIAFLNNNLQLSEMYFKTARKINPW